MRRTYLCSKALGFLLPLFLACELLFPPNEQSPTPIHPTSPSPAQSTDAEDRHITIGEIQVPLAFLPLDPALPSSAIPSNALPSNAIPANAQGDTIDEAELSLEAPAVDSPDQTPPIPSLEPPGEPDPVPPPLTIDGDKPRDASSDQLTDDPSTDLTPAPDGSATSDSADPKPQFPYAIEYLELTAPEHASPLPPDQVSNLDLLELNFKGEALPLSFLALSFHITIDGTDQAPILEYPLLGFVFKNPRLLRREEGTLKKIPGAFSANEDRTGNPNSYCFDLILPMAKDPYPLNDLTLRVDRVNEELGPGEEFTVTVTYNLYVEHEDTCYVLSGATHTEDGALAIASR
ncbi:MAG: hypothetical protein A2284_02860 [Deltaproteobacteria bacterium RIFOXYA12_FULL_61_11]|nr:MAG: hypothetical protein A2284_02860 [Deltaproteobacteria bacterium RIFOXYA12_FULL_61_11]